MSAVITRPGEGAHMWFAGGGVFEFKVTAEQSGGSLLLFEDTMQRGKRTPLHSHPGIEETIYVLEGEIVVHVDDGQHVVVAGGCVMVPGGVPHAFLVTSESARILAMLTPGTTAEAFYRDAGEAAGPADVDRPADFDRLRRAAERSPSIEILGPPPFVDDATPAGPSST